MSWYLVRRAGEPDQYVFQEDVFVEGEDGAEQRVPLVGYPEEDGFEVELLERAPTEYERYVDGEFVCDATLLDADLLARIDADAGVFRARFITSIPGQTATYLAKEDEARRWLSAIAAGDTPDPQAFPFLAATADGRALEIADAAELIVATADSWRNLGAAIEGRRERAKREVREATTCEAKREAAAVDWEALLTPPEEAAPHDD